MYTFTLGLFTPIWVNVDLDRAFPLYLCHLTWLLDLDEFSMQYWEFVENVPILINIFWSFSPFPKPLEFLAPVFAKPTGWTLLEGFSLFMHTHTHTNLSLSTRLLQIRWSYLIVTFLYYSVIGNALSRNPSSGQVVARVNILASDGWGSWRLSLHIMLLQKIINICISDTFNYKGYKRILRLQSLGLTV